MPDRYQVIIVGGGPVGVALAVELGQRGISCAVVERHATPQRIPKGQNLNQRSLEHFYFWHCADELRAARLSPPGYQTGNLTAYGSLMSDYWYGGAGAPANRGAASSGRPAPSLYFQSGERLPQYLTEEVLRARLEDLPCVDLLLRRSAGAVVQDQQGVRVTVIGEDEPHTEETLQADYLVGCDGARSSVRDQLGIEREGTDFGRRMVLAVLRSKELHEGLKRFNQGSTYQVMHPDLEGAFYFYGRVDVGESFFFHAPVPNDATADNYDFHALVQRGAGFPFACEFDHIGFFEMRIATATTYRAGRCFIAGDAAHSHPPYGAYGLNTGLEDATNLGWKLAAVLQGWGGAALLDSYGEERQPIFSQTGEGIIAAGIQRRREFLARYDPQRDLAEFEAAWQGMATGENAPYNPHYEGSSVVMGSPESTIGIHGRRTAEAVPGQHLAPVELSDGRNVYEALGPAFTLLALGAEDTDVNALEAAAGTVNLPLTVVRDALDEPRTQYAARLILIRPDQHVAWAGDAPPPDLAAMLRRVTGRP